MIHGVFARSHRVMTYPRVMICRHAMTCHHMSSCHDISSCHHISSSHHMSSCHVVSWHHSAAGHHVIASQILVEYAVVWSFKYGSRGPGDLRAVPTERGTRSRIVPFLIEILLEKQSFSMPTCSWQLLWAPHALTPREEGRPRRRSDAMTCHQEIACLRAIKT